MRRQAEPVNKQSRQENSVTSVNGGSEGTYLIV